MPPRRGFGVIRYRDLVVKCRVSDGVEEVRSEEEASGLGIRFEALEVPLNDNLLGLMNAVIIGR